MAWPLSQDYNEAIQSPQTSFADPELRAGQPALNAMGLPMPCSGNFADVYRFNCPAAQRTWAIKCFTREIPGLRERYRQISAYLKQVNLPFMVGFSFLDQGIRIRGNWYPILKMEWAEGAPFNLFVKDHLDKPQVLEKLCQIWVKLAGRLREANLAHCDLQHGNVLLVPGSKTGMLGVKLVDYDGMCVPSLTMLKSLELGHPSFQHPQRQRDGIYNLEVDRFSHLVIYTALRTLLVGGKDLWDRYDNGDNLLFSQADFKAPAASNLLNELRGFGDADVRRLANCVVYALQQPMAGTALLTDLVPDALPFLAQPVAKAQQVASATSSTPPHKQQVLASGAIGATRTTPAVRRKPIRSQGHAAKSRFSLAALCALGAAVLLIATGALLAIGFWLSQGTSADIVKTGDKEFNQEKTDPKKSEEGSNGPGSKGNAPKKLDVTPPVSEGAKGKSNPTGTGEADVPSNLPAKTPPLPKPLIVLSAAEQEKANTATKRGVDFLKQRQIQDGVEKGAWKADTAEQTLGYTALAGLTLLECDVSDKDDAVQNAAQFVRQEVTGRYRLETYFVSLSILFLSRLNDSSDRPLIRAQALRLAASQYASGGWGYACPPLNDRQQYEALAMLTAWPKSSGRGAEGPLTGFKMGAFQTLDDFVQPEFFRGQAESLGDKTDNSNTQFAVLALWAARRYDLPLDPVLRLVAKRFRNSQFPDGSWRYEASRKVSDYPTMTAAGLLGLAVGYGVGHDGKAEVNLAQDEVLQKGFKDLANKVGEPGDDPNKMPEMYFLWCVERVAVLYHLEKIEGKDWYRWGMGMVLAQQESDGRWFIKRGHAASDMVDTCFALLFLQRANFAKDLTNTLQKMRDVPSKGRATEASPISKSTPPVNKELPSTKNGEKERFAGAKVYLSDLQEFDWNGHDVFFKNGKAAVIGEISVRGEKFPKGLLTHPKSKSYASVKYKLDGLDAQTFEAQVAINDGAAPASALTFEVRGDDKVLWSSKPVQALRQIQNCSVIVKGTHVLELRVVCPGSYNWAWAVWLDPYLVRKTETKELPPADAEAEVVSPKKPGSWGKTVELDLGGAVKMKLVRIEPGKFLMGSPENEQGPRGDDEVLHEVEITKPFYLGASEVTRGEFRAFVKATGYQTEAEKNGAGADGYNDAAKQFEVGANYNWKTTGFEQTDSHPVVNVTWNDAKAFCAWLTKKTGNLVTLPTEAEWEHACRAGTPTRHFTGQAIGSLEGYANVLDEWCNNLLPHLVKQFKIGVAPFNDGHAFTSPGGHFKSNDWGLHDMHGNVAEWCEDWYDKDYYTSGDIKDPPGPAAGTFRIVRGGSFFAGLHRRCRSASREFRQPDSRTCTLGFRVAMRLPPGAKLDPTSLVQQDTRKRWVYSVKDVNGVFEQVGEQAWQENGGAFRFVEIERTFSYVKLHDASRGCSVYLAKKLSFHCWGTNPYHILYEGNWEDKLDTVKSPKVVEAEPPPKTPKQPAPEPDAKAEPKKAAEDPSAIHKAVVSKLTGTEWVNSNNVSFYWDNTGQLWRDGSKVQFDSLDETSVTVDAKSKFAATLKFYSDFTRFEESSDAAAKPGPKTAVIGKRMYLDDWHRVQIEVETDSKGQLRIGGPSMHWTDAAKGKPSKVKVADAAWNTANPLDIAKLSKIVGKQLDVHVPRLLQITPGDGTVTVKNDKTVLIVDFDRNGQAGAGKFSLVMSFQTKFRTSAGLIQRFVGHDGPVNDIALTPDLRGFVSVGDDKTVRRWEFESGKEVKKESADKKGMAGALSPAGKIMNSDAWVLALTPDSLRALVVHEDDMVDSPLRVVDISTGKTILTIPHAKFPAASFAGAFSPDAKRVSFNSTGNAVVLCDLVPVPVTTGKGKTAKVDIEWRVENRRLSSNEHAPITVLRFFSDGRRLFSGHTDGSIRIWDVNTLVETQRFQASSTRINKAIFMPDGRRLLVAANDGSIVLWALPD